VFINIKLSPQKFKFFSKIKYVDPRRVMYVKGGLTLETSKSVHIYVFRMHPKREPYKKSSRCSGRRKKTDGQAETKMGRWCDGRCQEVGGEKLKECCKE